MKKHSLGIDVSKKTLSICLFDGEKFLLEKNVENELTGWKKIVAIAKQHKAVITCEATGRLFRPLALYLAKNKLTLNVVNPAIIKNYTRMKMTRTKTDKIDARMIAMYGHTAEPCPYTNMENEESLKMLVRAVQHITEQRTATKNMIKAYELENFSVVVDEFKKMDKEMTQKIKVLKKEISKIVNEHYKKEKKILQSIRGIGEHGISVILAYLGTFSRFEHPEQLFAFIGTNVSETQSGTSVHGKPHISKKGNKFVRSALYLCALSASRYNLQCKALYDRLRARGKNGTLARIAVVNKLVKQCFHCVKKGVMYDPLK